jgi:hypothetical protein
MKEHHRPEGWRAPTSALPLLIQEVKKQIQRDIYAYLEPRCDAGIHKRHRQQAHQIALSQIVIDNFKNLEK